MKTSVLTLRHGDHQLCVAVEMGAIASWAWKGRDIFRPIGQDALEAREPLGAASFVMAPWVSRIKDSRFTFAGRVIQLAEERNPNLGTFAIHGEAWRATWRATASDPNWASLETAPSVVRAGGWPWPYRVSQEIGVSDDGLRHSLQLTSLADEPFPYALGLHPYFVRGPMDALTARVVEHVELDEAGMPAGRSDARARWRAERLTRGREDNCYSAWDGDATISMPSQGMQVSLRAEGCPFLHVYAPNEDYYCIEQQTSTPNALNAGTPAGLRVLEPGQSATIAVCFRPSLL